MRKDLPTPCVHNPLLVLNSKSEHNILQLPEGKLIYTILIAALSDVYRSSSEDVVRQDSIRWVFGWHPYNTLEYQEYLFSFDSICNILDIDPFKLRSKVVQMISEELC